MSVMKKILTFFMLLLILCACETRLTDNTDQDIFDFPKYREGVININTHNYMLENPLKVVPLIHSNLTPVKFSHSPFCLFLFSSYSSCPLCRVLH